MPCSSGDDELPRVTPKCPVFGRCGGCDWQDISYDAQLRRKEAAIASLLAPFSISPEVLLPIVPSPSPWGYRDRVQLHRDEAGHIGFFERRSHAVVAIDACPLARPEINREIAAIRANPGRMAVSSLDLLWDPRSQSVNSYVKGAETAYFAQINAEQNARLVRAVCEWVAPVQGMELLELYAGSGNFSLPLSKRGAEVTAVESGARAVERGMRASRGLSVHWFSMGVGQALREFLRENRRWECALLDPPRRGLADGIDLLLKLAPRRIFYVSCNPESFVRDLSIFFQKGGYRLARLSPFDFFPQTQHVELLAEFVTAS